MKYLSGVASIRLDAEKCSGCGTCLEVCPHNVFALEKKKAVIKDPDACMECGACMENCPSDALSVGKGVGCASAIINGIISGGEPSCDCSCKSGKKNCC